MSEARKPLLHVEDINVYYGLIHALRDVSFEVNEGEVVALIGSKLLIVIGVIQKAGRSLFALCHGIRSSLFYFVPVEPKPPRLSSLSLSTVTNSSSGCLSMMRNWQMRSFFFICVSRRA